MYILVFLEKKIFISKLKIWFIYILVSLKKKKKNKTLDQKLLKISLTSKSCKMYKKLGAVLNNTYQTIHE